MLSICQLHILLSRTSQISLELHFCVELHTKKPCARLKSSTMAPFDRAHSTWPAPCARSKQLFLVVYKLTSYVSAADLAQSVSSLHIILHQLFTVSDFFTLLLDLFLVCNFALYQQVN